jgi:hypothetical protein
MIYRVMLTSPDTGQSVRSQVEFELVYTIINPPLVLASFIRAFDLTQRLVVLSYADRVTVLRWPEQSLDVSGSSEERMTLSMQTDDLEELVRTRVSPCAQLPFLIYLHHL